MKKKPYISPDIHFITCSNETILAGSGGSEKKPQVYLDEEVEDDAEQFCKKHNLYGNLWESKIWED